MPDPADPFERLSVEHTSTVDRVADELRRAAFEGEVESGTPLREVAIAESLGVSRSTVREALGLLVAEGIATRSPNRGVHVASPDPDSVRDVCRARAVLEVEGVRRWPGASEQARDAVRSALVDYTAAVREGASYQRLNDKHLALHLALVGLIDSPRLMQMAESLYAELRLALAQRPDPPQRARPGGVAWGSAAAARARRHRRGRGRHRASSGRGRGGDPRRPGALARGRLTRG
jgi:DNA-binding GntR family transcriptional regulator